MVLAWPLWKAQFILNPHRDHSHIGNMRGDDWIMFTSSLVRHYVVYEAVVIPTEISLARVSQAASQMEPYSPYMVHYFGPGPCSKVVHYVHLGMHAQCRPGVFGSSPVGSPNIPLFPKFTTLISRTWVTRGNSLIALCGPCFNTAGVGGLCLPRLSNTYHCNEHNVYHKCREM
jgi:hypothetical protein